MRVSLASNKGFTLIEMVIVCLLFVIVLGITSDAFNRIVSKSISLSKTAESNISGMVGLELMRSDLQAAGYGVPWSFPQAIVYSEATTEPGLSMNDPSSGVPRAVTGINNITSADPTRVFDQSDTLAVRAQSVANNTASKRWSYVESKVMPTGNPVPAPHNWGSENLADTNTIIMTAAIVNMQAANQLVVNPADGTWYAPYKDYKTIGEPPEYNDAEKKSDAYVMYGVSDSGTLRMPFNRADYFIRRPNGEDPPWFQIPQRCNPATGALVKEVVNQSDGKYTTFPILDCVLDMQVVYSMRTPPTSAVVTDFSDISGAAFSAQDIRDQLKEIKVYLLTHDGGRDRNFTYPNPTIGVGPGNGLTSGSGSTYDFAARGVPNWQQYHWRVYQIVARPGNLVGGAAQ